MESRVSKFVALFASFSVGLRLLCAEPAAYRAGQSQADAVSKGIVSGLSALKDNTHPRIGSQFGSQVGSAPSSKTVFRFNDIT